MKKLLIYLFSVFILIPPPVFGISSQDLEAIETNTIYYSNDHTACYPSGGASTLPHKIPDPYRTVFQQAADKYDVDVLLIATVHKLEQPNSYQLPVPSKWPESPTGAEGPFQFVDNTWNGYKEDADGDGRANIESLVDAAHAAAHYISDLGGKKGIALGSLQDDFSQTISPATVAWVLKSYNGGGGTKRDSDGRWYYLSGGRKVYWKSKKQHEINNYIERGLGFYVNYSGGNAPSGASSAPIGCGGLGVGTELTFPLRTTKRVIYGGADGVGGNGDEWCYRASSNCHGSYFAADIHAPEGTPVVAAVGGEVYRAFGTSVYASVRIKGEDGLWYFYQHMAPGSTAVNVGDYVAPGTQLGVVGDSAAAEGTAPHLHFDVARELLGISRECVNSGGCAREKNLMVDSQPSLVDAFSNLPEN